MIYEKIEKRIKGDFPAAIRSNIVPAIKRGYSSATSLLLKESWLNWIVGKESLSIIRRAAVEFELMKLADLKRFTANCNIKSNAADNCHHIEIQSGDGILTCAQLKNSNDKPRTAIYRNKLSSFNIDQISMFETDDKVNDISSTYYGIIAYGGETLDCPDFVFIGIPTQNVKSWYYKLDLLGEPSLIERHDEELITTDDNLIELKDYLIKTGVVKND